MRKVFCIGFGERDALDLCQTALNHGIEHRKAVWTFETGDHFKSLADYLKEYGGPPPADAPYSWYFNWDDFYAFSENNHPQIDPLEDLFPDCYYIFDNRGLHNWLTRLFISRGVIQFSNGELIPALDLNGLQEAIVGRREYYSYCQNILERLQGHDRCAVIDLEQDDSPKIQSALQAAIGNPIELAYIEIIKRSARNHVEYPAFIEEALRKSGIPESEWHQTAL